MPTIDGATLGTVWMALAAALLIFVWWLSLRRVLPRMTPKRRNRMLLWTYAVPLLAGPLLPLADDAGHPGKRFMLKLLLLLAWVLLIAIVYNITYKNKPNMRKKIVAGNWKMNTLPAEGVELAKGVVAGRGEVCRCVDFIVCPPFTHLSMVAEALKGSDIALGAQDCAAEAKGAYTGEVAASMIAALGCKYVILGHSERRQYYGETSATLNKKMEQAYANNLTPIYCVGENLDEREAGKHFDVVKQQIEEVVYNLSAE